MNVISKILPIKYLSYFDTVKGVFDVSKNENVIEIESSDKIRETIVSLLFSDGPKTVDYLLVTFEDKMFVVERDSISSYCKRVITYHPLMEKVKL